MTLKSWKSQTMTLLRWAVGGIVLTNRHRFASSLEPIAGPGQPGMFFFFPSVCQQKRGADNGYPPFRRSLTQEGISCFHNSPLLGERFSMAWVLHRCSTRPKITQRRLEAW